MMSPWFCLGLLVVAQLCAHTSQRPLKGVQEYGEETWTPEYPTQSYLADDDDQLTDEDRDKSDEEPSNYKDELNDEEVSEEDDEGTDKPSDYSEELNDDEIDEEKKEDAENPAEYADEEADDLDKLRDEVIERNDAGRYTQNHKLVAVYNRRVARGKPAPAPKSTYVTDGRWGTRIALPRYSNIGKDETTRLTGRADAASSRRPDSGDRRPPPSGKQRGKQRGSVDITPGRAT